MAWAKGFAAEDARTAFGRAQELAAGVDNADERFAAYYGRCLGSIAHGELMLAAEIAEIFECEAEKEARATEADMARRFMGLIRFLQGDFNKAQAICARVMRSYDVDRDRGAQLFGMDTRVAATMYLAHASWALGEVDRAREFIEAAVALAGDSGHIPNRVNAYTYRAIIEVLGGDAKAALRDSDTVVQLSREHGMPMYLALGSLFSDWANARLGKSENRVSEFRQELAALTDNKVYEPFSKGLRAEIEARAGGVEEALAGTVKALELAQETGEHWTDAFLHRIRGEILLKRDPANSAPAEEAFLTAIAVAQQQKAKSFELQAAHALAKLYQSSGRTADAHAVLAPALEGFSPTPEFPEISEAQRLLATLTA
jgi:predicted ATPase